MVRLDGEPAVIAAANHLLDFERILAPHLTAAFHLAQAMLRDPHEAEDAVQEAAIKAWTKFHQFKPGTSFRAWYLAIVANHCRSTMRTPWWRLGRTAEPPDLGTGGLEELAVSRMDLARVLNGLSDDQRALLYLSFELDLPLQEIAAVLGVRPGTVKSRLHRLVGRLRAAMNDGGRDR